MRTFVGHLLFKNLALFCSARSLSTSTVVTAALGCCMSTPSYHCVSQHIRYRHTYMLYGICPEQGAGISNAFVMVTVTIFCTYSTLSSKSQQKLSCFFLLQHENTISLCSFISANTEAEFMSTQLITLTNCSLNWTLCILTGNHAGRIPKHSRREFPVVSS